MPWKVGAREEGLLIVIKEYRHRPATTASQREGGLHVDSINVGALFTIDLDRHEALIDDSCHLSVLEGFMRHDMTPVAG